MQSVADLLLVALQALRSSVHILSGHQMPELRTEIRQCYGVLQNRLPVQEMKIQSPLQAQHGGRHGKLPSHRYSQFSSRSTKRRSSVSRQTVWIGTLPTVPAPCANEVFKGRNISALIIFAHWFGAWLLPAQGVNLYAHACKKGLPRGCQTKAA